MNKLFAFVLTMAMVLSLAAAAMADGRTAPEDMKIIEDGVEGAVTQFRKYDAKFWDEPSEQPGTIVRMDYTTDVYGDPINNWLNVYLPYGYDETRQYDIMYFFHGTNETPDSFIGMEKAKNCVDNMIETGVAKPFIMVFPTYYYDYENRATDKDLFAEEMRKDIMPLVESTYSTYAPTADDAGFAASRDHRAMSGYSQGSQCTWVMLNHLLDTARWWLPLSVASNAANVKAGIEAQAEYKDDFFIYMGCGGKRDLAYDGTIAMLKDVAENDFFSFGNDLHTNNFFCTISTEPHTTVLGRYYLYNAFCDGLLQ